MIDKDEDGGLNKWFERHDGVPMETKKANEQNSDGEYEEELDSAGMKNTGINLDSPDDMEDHKKNEERLKVKAQEEQEQQHRYEEFVEEEATYAEELEEEEFEKEEEEQVNENKEGEEKQPKREEQEEEKEEKIQQEQNYETNLKHEQDEKYKKGYGETNEEHKYKEDETEDPDKRVDEHEEKDEQVQPKTQNERSQNDDQGQQDEQDESEVLGEQDDEEEENYRKLGIQSEGLKNEQRPDKQIEEKVIAQNYKESMKHDNNKQASISKMQSFKATDDDQEENEGVPLNNRKRNDDLTGQDEGEENRGKSNHKHDDLTVQDEDKENKGKSSHEHDDLTVQDEDQENKVKASHEHNDLTVQDEDEKNKGSSSHEHTERFGALLDTVIKPASVLNESKANDKSSVAQDVKDSVYLPPLKRAEERVGRRTDRTEGDVRLKEDGYSTEVSEMDKDETTINRETGQENNTTKSTELANQGPDETEEVCDGPEVGY